MKLSKLEQESIILYNEEESTASIYTHDPKLKRKLKRLAEKYPDKVYPDKAVHAGAVSYAAAIPIIMGQNIGTTVTAMLSSVGTNKNARRAAVVHLLFNVIGVAVLLSVFCIVRAVLAPALLDESATRARCSIFSAQPCCCPRAICSKSSPSASSPTARARKPSPSWTSVCSPRPRWRSAAAAPLPVKWRSAPCVR